MHHLAADHNQPTRTTDITTDTQTAPGSLIRSLSAGTMEGPYSARFPSSSIGEKSRRATAGREAADERSTRCHGPHRRERGARHPRRASGHHDFEGPQMAGDAEFKHLPVMVGEITRLFEPVPAGVVIDATLGGGGHARALLAAHPHVRVLGIDQDDAALAAASSLIDDFPGRVTLVRSRFDRLDEVADEYVGEHAADAPISGVLFDLGVSSPQLDQPDRGFSYRHDAPLDMRMDRSASLTAAEVVNTYDVADLAVVLRDFGDERFATRIARAIVAARPVTTTGELAELVRDAIPAPARRRGGHPAKRTFQAVRIEVNRELAILPATLDRAIDLLVPGGRIAVLSYHSGEDRIVKGRLRQAETGGCVCPPGLPCVCGAEPTVRLLKRGGWTPSPAELMDNPRSESARLRAAERLSVPGSVVS
jgi:16S rRNA (cytosine1402-N4)-methyltransferase